MSKLRIKELSSLILKHKELYYSGQAELADEEYDAIEKELTALSAQHPTLGIVGSAFFSGEKVKHDTKMLSLSKTYIEDELVSWLNGKEVIATYKVDGNSASIIYENGSFTLAKTRGDGEFGENISKPSFYIKSIPKKISTNKKVEVRGEIYCSKENFEILVEEMLKRGMDRPKSERNIVAGILGRKEHKDLAQYLDFLAFDYLSEDDVKLEEDKCKKLADEGFVLPPNKKIKNKKDLLNFVNQTQKFMEEGTFLIDGAVFSYNKISDQEEAGFNGHHPKFKIAFKFAGEVKESTIININWQISRFGVFTPVGDIEPVELAGATITNVTLHNLKNVKNFNLKKGDTIKIIRSGEVIPKFLSVVKSSKNKINIPESCSFCKSNLVQEDVRLMCNNIQCSGRHEKYILDFIKKIGIDDLSDKRLRPMMELGLVNSVLDLYTLTEAQLLTLPKTKEKMAKKIIKNIEKTKKVNVIKFLSALSLTGGARKSTETILDSGVKNFDELFELKADDLVKLKGLAEIKANNYVNSLRDNKDIINGLLNLGFEVEFPQSSGSSILKDKTFCITGELVIASNRKVLEDLIKNEGGKSSSSVSSKTNFLICNEVSSSSKYVKAESLGVEILTEKQFEDKFKLKI
jgi:DNA ligase (NAD+)